MLKLKVCGVPLVPMIGLVAVAMGGCTAARDKTAPSAPVVATPDSAASRPASYSAASARTVPDPVRADPAGFIRRVAERSRELRSYTVTLTRTERRGLFGKVFGPERIACWFRRTPFSIRMKWLDPDVKYGESTYIAGAHENKVRFVPRHGLFGLPPGITVVDLQTPVTWGESKNPVTDFGLERMMDRTLASMSKAGSSVAITYRGLVTPVELGRSVHHLRLEYPPQEWKTPFHDLYIDPSTELPAGSVLSLRDGKLDASYFYTDLDLAARPTDADFLLDIEKPAASAAPATQPSKVTAAAERS